MRKLWIVARHEYGKIVRTRSFIIGTLATPLVFAIILAVSILAAVGADRRPVGYVDRAGILRPEALQAAQDLWRQEVAFQAFADEDAARAALADGHLQAVFVLPEDYLATLAVEEYYWEDEPSAIAGRDFERFLRASLAAELPAAARERVLAGTAITIRSADGRQEVGANGAANLILSFGIGFLFVIAVLSAAGYLVQAVTDEKENRTIEIVTTSVAPRQLIGGKAVGLIGVGLTQLALLLAVIGVGLAIGAQYLEPLRDLQAPWTFAAVVGLYFLPAYVLMAGVMIGIGSLVTEVRQAQQVAGILNLAFTLPYFFLVVFLFNPDGLLATLLTLFPTTSFVTITLRWGLTVIPAWQLVLGWVLLVASAAASVWAAGRIFRHGMLRYGQRVTLRGVLALVRSGAR